MTLTQASGCAYDVPPTTMQCPSQSRDATLHLTGTHFGGTDAVVLLSTDADTGGTARQWACRSVQHVPGGEDTGLLCSSWQLVTGLCKASGTCAAIWVALAIASNRHIPIPGRCFSFC